MTRAKKNLIHFVLLICAIFFASNGFAQQTQATITGQVADPQGATLANAQVTISNLDTAISRTVETSDAGRYKVTNLNPGRYSVSVKMAGFSEKVLTGVVLAVGQDASLDVALSLGSASDVVTVNAEASVTDTESSSQGTVIDNQKVVGLPLNQRTFYGLALLSPAAYMPAQNSTLGFRGGFNVAGNNETANTFTVNGIDDNDQNVMAPSFRPSVEGIQEFKLLTGVYPAEYGRTSGGQVVVVIKTGTNKIHGDVFEFIRNSQFDAKNYFTPVGAPTTFRRNQFGGTIGGPIIKDRTFFFGSYEGLRLAQPAVVSGTVPNPAFLTGDFSSLLSQATPVQLVNPVTKAPYARNQIPTSSFSPLGLAILKLYPAPDAGYDISKANPTYTLNAKRVENLNQYSVRLDHKISEKDSLLVQYNYFNDPSFEPSNSLCGSATIPGFGCTTNQISTLAGINYTHILSEHWVNEFRFGYDRLEQPRVGEDVTLTNFPKLQGAFNDPSISSTINGGAPQTTVSGYSSIHPYGNLPQHRWDNHYNLVNNTTWSHGNHNVKFGVNMLQARYSIVFVSNGTGALTFTASGTNGAQTSGNAAADLALGYATTSTRTPTAPTLHYFYNALSGYAQDDWKITSHLTLNYGMRYEYFSPTQDRQNSLSSYELPTSANPAGSIIVAGFGAYGSKLYQDDANNFAPRVGLAYQPYGSDKTVVHASYGIFYNSPAIGNGANLNMGFQVPFRLNQSFTSSPSSPTTPTPQIQIDTQPFPSAAVRINGVTVVPNGTVGAPYQNVAPTGIDPKFATLYMNEYGADIQQQITSTTSLTIGYIGNEGARIPRLFQPNQGVVTSATTGTVSSVRPLGSTPVGPVGPAGMYYQMGNVSYYISSGHSTYHALTVKGQKNMGNGLSFILAYTWGKSVDNANGYASGSQSSSGTAQNSLNLNAERGLSDFNVSSRLVLSPVYELPFGKNRMFLTHGFAAAVAGGWQVSGIYSYQTGRPFTIAASTNRSGSINGADRPNVTGNPNNGPKTVAQFFNTSAFTANDFGKFGNESRNALIGPGYSDIDIAVQRNFAITERYGVQVRAESFNLANKANFLNPLGTGTGQFIPSAALNSTPSAPVGNSNPLFGRLTAANDPRSIQFSAKVIF